MIALIISITSFTSLHFSYHVTAVLTMLSVLGVMFTVTQGVSEVRDEKGRLL